MFDGYIPGKTQTPLKLEVVHDGGTEAHIIPVPNTQTWKCSECIQVFGTKGSALRHAKNHMVETLYCPFANECINQKGNVFKDKRWDHFREHLGKRHFHLPDRFHDVTVAAIYEHTRRGENPGTDRKPQRSKPFEDISDTNEIPIKIEKGRKRKVAEADSDSEDEYASDEDLCSDDGFKTLEQNDDELDAEEHSSETKDTDGCGMKELNINDNPKAAVEGNKEKIDSMTTTPSSEKKSTLHPRKKKTPSKNIKKEANGVAKPKIRQRKMQVLEDRSGQRSHRRHKSRGGPDDEYVGRA